MNGPAILVVTGASGSGKTAAVQMIQRSVSILDGQTRPSFVRAALAATEAADVRVVLLDCRSDVRQRRLAARGHPEPATARTDAWAAYLRGQAEALDLPVIDTSELTVAETADAVEAQVDAFGVDPRARRR